VRLTSPEPDSSLINSASSLANETATLRVRNSSDKPVIFAQKKPVQLSLNQENAAPLAEKLSS
jgi:hypothetical protein